MYYLQYTYHFLSPLAKSYLSPFIFYSLIYIYIYQCNEQTATIRGIRTRHNIHLSIKTRREIDMDHPKCIKCTLPTRLQKLEIKRTELRCLDGVEEDGCREGVGYGCCSGLVRFQFSTRVYIVFDLFPKSCHIIFTH